VESQLSRNSPEGFYLEVDHESILGDKATFPLLLINEAPPNEGVGDEGIAPGILNSIRSSILRPSTQHL
jgi:hypothetical protein